MKKSGSVSISSAKFGEITQFINLKNTLPSPSSYTDKDVYLHPENYADYGFSISQEQGTLIYMLCRAINARHVIDFATSVGMSAMYLCAAVKDNGGGMVIGSELVPEKANVALLNLTNAGLREYIDIRVGDARQTLKNIEHPVDFAMIDGWPGISQPSLSREILDIITPSLRTGAIIINDNAEADYLDFIREPKNGFLSLSIPVKGMTEISMKVS